MGIGAQLSDGQKHDGRAPDYDDWSTVAENGLKGLNGDLLVWDDILDRAMELSSMGIRVNKEALLRQLTLCNAEEKKELYFHQRLLNDELPLSMAAELVSPVCVCFTFVRVTSARFRQVFGRSDAQGGSGSRHASHLILIYMDVKIEESWKERLSGEFEKDYFRQLTGFVKEEYKRTTVYPPGPHIFEAFNACPFNQVKVVILGQDPYHEPGQAHGLCFSVQDGTPYPPSWSISSRNLKRTWVFKDRQR